jgi:hypothetical protein
MFALGYVAGAGVVSLLAAQETLERYLMMVKSTMGG